MTRGKSIFCILLYAVIAVISGHSALAQDRSTVHAGDSLHASYDFVNAKKIYLQALDSLDVVEDSLLVQDIREKLRMTENGKNMSRFVQSPQPAGDRKSVV